MRSKAFEVRTSGLAFVECNSVAVATESYNCLLPGIYSKGANIRSDLPSNSIVLLAYLNCT